jgi:single-strand DNA-binding protein
MEEKKTQWVRFTLFGKRAETVAPYMKKGTALSVVIDEPRTELYEKKDGTAGVSLSGILLAFDFAGGKNSDLEAPAAAPGRQPAAGISGITSMEDDIPF